MFLVQDDNYKITNGGKRVRRMTRDEADKLKNSINIALKNNSSIGKKYIKDLIERVALNTGGEIISTEILDLFNKVFESRGDDPTYGGIWIFTKPSNGSFAVNHWDWVGGRGSAELHMHFSNNMPKETEKLTEEDRRDLSILSYLTSPEKGGMPTIHELMHVAVKGHHKGTPYSVAKDDDYAYAVADLAGEKRPVFIPANAVIYQKFTTLETLNNALPSHIIVAQNKGTAASAYWGQRLLQACDYPSHITNKKTKFKLYKDEVM